MALLANKNKTSTFFREGVLKRQKTKIKKVLGKKMSVVKIAGLTVVMASFLMVPVFYSLAQENLNTDSTNTENTNTTPTQTNDSPEQVIDSENEEDNITFDDLNEQLSEKQAIIDELKRQADIYEKNIKVKQQEAITLQNQISLLDLQIEQTELDIETVKEEVDQVNLEIEKLKLAIEEKNDELDYRKKVLADFLRLINQYDQQSYLEIFMAHQSFSDFFDNFRYTQDLEDNVNSALNDLKDVKAALEQQQKTQEDKRDELNVLTDKLASSIVNLNDQKDYKSVLIEETKESEEKFSLLLDEANREQQAVMAEINSLEALVRQELEEGGVDLNIEATLMWPVAPTKGISAYFHDPTYPFRRYFEHPAIDIPQPQGTSIRAAESGYVARAKNGGMGYSYIMIVHNNEISTVYGHVSQIDVIEDDYVVRGQVIGAVGGIPGTPGAGRLTTGPHLHFEVRSNGIPVNPLDYLPAL